MRLTSLFKRQPTVEDQIEAFLVRLNESAVLFHDVVKAYLLKDGKNFSEKQTVIIKLEKEADSLRRAIEAHIYRKNLIPESSSDVLVLLEKLDNVLNQLGFATNLLSIEQPNIPKALYHQFEHIAYTSMQATGAIVLATQHFFKNIPQTQDTIEKVWAWESEGDRAVLRLQRIIFQGGDVDTPLPVLDLSQKLHLKAIANAINEVSDLCEDAADLLQIFVIKHSF